MKDKIGQDIVPGCFIVYATLLGRSAGLKIGKVKEITDQGKIAVEGVSEHTWNDKIRKCQTGFLYYPDRALVIPESSIPEKFLNLFKTEGANDV